MEQKDKVILWLAHDEIDDMREYIEELKNNDIPAYARIAVWGLAFTKSWYRRIERPQFAIYNTILKCKKKLPCPDCYKKIMQKKQAEIDKKKGIKGMIDTFSEVMNKETPKTNASEENKEDTKNDEAKKDSEESSDKKEKEEEEDSESDDLLDDDEIASIIGHLDCDFSKEEKSEKSETERLYTMRIVMYALTKSYEYNMLISHERVHKKNVDKIFGLCIGAFSYFSAYHIENLFKVVFFLASNINGIFSTKKGQSMTKKEFDRFLLFVQNTAALSKNKFMILIDVISSLNQEVLTKFIYDIIKGDVSVSGVQKDLFDKYSKPSVNEIEEFKKNNPFSILSKFTPRIIILHQKETKTLDEFKRENAYLKENIETLLSDLKHSNTCGFIAQLKKDLEEANEQIKKLTDK
ncbi:uncharacterized protein NEPG_01467 [Nematocida parisii ERTm1]|uniref:uncharacterized protein n=1 Tax=Nematocida parisii (strain ERTm1 / ATCC PRA-289) TaxID=881290 RepID=UPI000264B2A4|nr:uncharacterized protein NEPG_01467 [Nematocida parisii ERTm1]EIJ93895.1 hypothetical protein NEPG_01467 [Nematocida parisii ERTm1]KAI5128436.1 hypothetical protein NEPAR08_1247 [Nematocida parisii]KAI5128477.1 hypothetical protein NEPAR03_1331 [Nematocida parisii]KAI5145168.1 hypothetical protein NEPAR04_2362 [Nematocida parisii]|eukprot:XP_013059295.1 hypothetical protein NEPG_01467 [Nematocida parisii ERTm1]